MKKPIILAAAAALALTASAVPAKPRVHSFLQSDGSQISLRLVGDEHFHIFTTPDGLAVEQAENGDFHYATAACLSSVMVHNPGSRSAAEAQFLAENHAQAAVEAVAKARLSERKAIAPASAAPARAPQMKATQVPQNGSPRVPVLLVSYKNLNFRDGNDALQTFSDFFETGQVSCRQYFIDQSNGKYTPQFDVYGPFKLANSRSYYGENDAWGNDKRLGAMVAEACKGLQDEVDFSLYDNNGDGECDVVIVLYAGVGEASTGKSESVWPCQWELSGSDYGKSITLNGTKVNKFAVFNESLERDGGPIDGIGTFCHEFSHCLGLPDWYETTYAHGYFGMGNWSVLDAGCYANDGFTPIGYTAYEKQFMGWIDIPEAEENTLYTLPVFNQKDAATDVALKVTNPADPDEYYVLENHAQQGWDEYLPAEGMLITHVTYSQAAWDSNTVNNQAMQRMTPIPADNALKMDYYYGYYYINEKSLLGDLWPYGNATELTDTSTPAATVNTGGLMGRPITEIKRDRQSKLVSFWFMKGALPTLPTPVALDAEDIAEDAFTAVWSIDQLPHEAIATYTLAVTEMHTPDYSLALDADFANGVPEGWTTEGFTANSAGVGLRLGSSSATGSVTSPAVTADGHGELSVVFTAKLYSEETAVVVTLLDAEGNELASDTPEISKDMATYKAVFTVEEGHNYSIRFATPGPRKRSIIGHVAVYNGNFADADDPADDRYTTIYENIADTRFRFDGLTSLATYTWKVKAVPADPQLFNESQWSEPATVTLAKTGITAPTSDGGSSAPAEHYNLQGIRVASPVPGQIYIEVRGHNAHKILWK